MKKKNQSKNCRMYNIHNTEKNESVAKKICKNNCRNYDKINNKCKLGKY